MNGGVRIRTEAGEGGRTRVVELSASAPLAAKVTGDHEVHLVGTAAAPLDGDVVTIDLEVGDHTQLTVGTVAATMAWPARGDVSPSVMIIRAKVGEGAVLRWLPEQLVPVRGCRHVLRSDVQLAATASVLWREEVILGRTGEPPGTLDAELRVVRAGVPLLHQQLQLDGHDPSVHGAPSLLAVRAPWAACSSPDRTCRSTSSARPMARCVAPCWSSRPADGLRAPPPPRPRGCARGSTSASPASRHRRRAPAPPRRLPTPTTRRS